MKPKVKNRGRNSGVKGRDGSPRAEGVRQGDAQMGSKRGLIAAVLGSPLLTTLWPATPPTFVPPSHPPAVNSRS